MKTQFLVLPYNLEARNKIEAQQAQPCRTGEEARRTGERMAKRFHGVVVLFPVSGLRRDGRFRGRSDRARHPWHRP